jgi:transposase-like protein
MAIGRRLTDETRREIAERYAAGERTAHLAREYGVVYDTIANCVKRCGGVPRVRRHMTDGEKRHAIRRYKAGASSIHIAKELGFTDVAVLNMLVRSGVQRRNKADARRAYPLNEHAFDVLTPAAEYWLGVLMADGCVSVDRDRVVLSLKTSDRGHLELFKSFLGTTKPLGVVEK